MKPRTLFVKFLFLIASLGITGPLLSDVSSSSKPAAKVKHEIPGLAIPRSNGRFLGLEIDQNSNFKLSFYDKDKAPVAADLALATFRWRYPNDKKHEEFVGLTPGCNGKCLTSPRVIRRPWTFKLTILLFAAGSNEPVENYTVDYNG